LRCLTAAEAVEINAEVLGGRAAGRDLRLLESAVARSRVSAFKMDAYPDVISQAAALLHSLVLNHAFVDGNKRTAAIAPPCRIRYNVCIPGRCQGDRSFTREEEN